MAARRAAEYSLRPSVLDRILGERGVAGGGLTAAGTVASARAAILRDLEWLLNTRRIYTGPGEGRSELAKSVYTYGLPDPSSLDRGSAAVAYELTRDLTDAIRIHEPRLSSVRVAIREPEEGEERGLHFIVEAVLDVDPEPVPVTFDTHFDVGKGSFDVEVDRV